MITPSEVEPFDRGNGVATIPYVGKWNCADNQITTGQTSFQPGTGLPLHSHNYEESVLILEGEAVAQIDDDTYDLEVGQATWVPAGVPHRFYNRGEGVMRIYWVYGGRDVTRTITATGETFEHLSPNDKGGLSTADQRRSSRPPNPARRLADHTITTVNPATGESSGQYPTWTTSRSSRPSPTVRPQPRPGDGAAGTRIAAVRRLAGELARRTPSRR